MAVEPLPLPIRTSLPVLPAMPTSAQAERFRSVIAIAAASVFVSGAGIAYVEAQTAPVAPSSAVGTVSGSVSQPVTEAAPAAAVAVPPAVSDAGPLRRNGAGTAADAAQPARGAVGTPSSDRSVSSARQSAQQATAASSRSSESSTRRRASAVSGSSAATSSANTSSANTSSANTSSALASSTAASPTRTSSARSTSTTSSAGPVRYAVRSGDDFGVLAARFGVSSTRIAALNPGVDSSTLSIGQTLRIR